MNRLDIRIVENNVEMTMGGRAMLVLDINYCCDLFTDYISARAHYHRVCSTLVPSVACHY